MKNRPNTNLIIRSILAFALALAIWSPVQALSAEPAGGNMMNHTNGGMGGWTSGWIWVWTVVGVLVAVLLVAVIIKMFKK